MYKISSILLSAFVFIISSCSNSNSTDSEQRIQGVDLNSLNTEVDPCHDFYGFANGNWIKSNPIPSTESRWSNFNVLRDRNDSLLIDILKDAGQGKGDERVGNFYLAAMDTAKINELGIEALRGELDKINAIENVSELSTLIAHLHLIGLAPFISTGVDQDIKNNTEYAMYLGTGALGLPDKDYYLNDALAEKKAEYVKHLQAMFELLGYSSEQATAKVTQVMEIETALANSSLSRVDRRDPERTYNKRTLEELSSEVSLFDWKSYYAAINTNPSNVIVTEPAYMAAFNEILSSTPLESIKTFLEWNLVNETANKIGDDFEQQNFDFYYTYLSGVKEMKPRWKRVLSQANASLGELLGKEYVKVAFSEENKKKVNEMVDNLIVVLAGRIKGLDWMGDETKKQALHKLNSITRKMGYPDEWKDYSSLALSKDSHVQNWFNCNIFDFKNEMSKMGKEIDRKEWFMAPQIVNAYYNPVMNEIVFPAGILQPPFFSIDVDDAINYGSMGAVIGHELTHGFDDQGNQFDAEGNLKNWWTEEDKANFNAKAKQLIDQYAAYEVLDSTFINGELTQGENIADLGGLSIAYEAYINTLGPAKEKEIDGYTPSQRFFISFGQVWRNNQTDEYLKKQVLTDPHSPAMFRVIGVVENMPEFNEAFGTCKPKADSTFVKIW